MSKRKAMIGGYEESSDIDVLSDSGEDANPPSKRKPSASYAPPRLTTTSKSGPAAFQLPGARPSAPPHRHVSVSSAPSRRPTPAVENVRGTPRIQISVEPDPEPMRGASTAKSPSDASNLAVPNGVPKQSDELPPASHKTIAGRSSLALERKIHELTETFEEYKNASEGRHKSNEGTLSLILETVNRLDPSNSNLSTSRAPTPFITTSPSPVDVKPLFSNPIPTPELISLVQKIVSEARSRVGKKKGGSEDNSCKEHARNTFYRMLSITAASEIRPYFEDEYGEPDTLPAQFVDPDTKYCRPYPHWKASLVKQAAWIPTYILRFRSTIPSDQSELSIMLRGLTDQQILILLNDGPFKSACASWRNNKKTDLEIEGMRSSARRYQRCERKAVVRATHIRTILSLQGQEWEYLTHPGYMSQDESDEEGELITKRPEHQARWATNLYEAIRVAEREKAKARPGLCPRLPPPKVELVKRPIPHLERGTGSGKVTIRIAACGISKSWREAYPDELQKSVHLLNMKETTKPDISSFLIKHPVSQPDGSDNVKKQHNLDGEASDSELWAFGTQVDGQLPEGETYGMQFGTDTGDNATGGRADGGGDSTAVTHNGLEGEIAMGPERVQGPDMLTDGPNTLHKARIPIDPVLLREDTLGSSNCSGGKTSLPLGASQDVFGTPVLAPGFRMPSPPFLHHNPSIAGNELTVIDDTQVKGKSKQGKNSTGVEGSVGAVEPAPGPKRRGRPIGSKNKPKAVEG